MWYSKYSWLRVFTPLSWVLSKLVEHRRSRYSKNTKRVWNAPVPVCVVGNITVGGTGKTPLVIWLSQWLIHRGFRVGIVSRGYGSKASSYPISVTERSRCQEVGEENILLHRRTLVPIVVDPQRVRATQFLLKNHAVDVVISDDGLQHYRLGRNIEIAVFDGTRGIGNGLQIPFGPLREPKKRLSEVHWLVAKNESKFIDLPAFPMQLEPIEFVNLGNDSALGISEFKTQYSGPLRAIAAIGNPQSFQDTLDRLEIQARVEAFRDHHYFRVDELDANGSVIIVTEKDAQKIRELPMDAGHIWYLRVDVKFKDNIDGFLGSMFREQGLNVKERD